MTDSLVLEGECYLTEYEGGFTPPAIDVGGQPLDRSLLLWRFGALPKSDRGCTVDPDQSLIGKVRITVERIDGPTD